MVQGRAFYLVQGEHLRGEAKPPRPWSEYEVVVCNPALPPDDVRESIAAHDGRKPSDITALAYVNARSVSDAGPENLWWTRFRSHWTQNLFAGLDGANNARELKPSFPAYAALVEAIRDEILPVGWDGIYLDDLTEAVPPARLKRVAAASSLADIPARWRALMAEYFLPDLWDACEKEGILLIANTAGWVPGLTDGVCVESEHILRGLAQKPEWLALVLERAGFGLNIAWDADQITGAVPGLLVLGDSEII